MVNFSPGPSALPEAVKRRIREEAFDWAGPGISVMEVSHRGPQFTALADRATAALGDLLQLPERYRILFVQGGASMQFALAPLNFAAADQPPPVYLGDGHWGCKAASEARRLRNCVEKRRDEVLPEQAAYLHTTSNETIDGRQWMHPPATALPVLCDMSSDILSRPIDVSEYAFIYAGAQKNAGIAGLTLLVVDEQLLARCPDHLPTLVNYRAMAAAESMANTPPTFAWYVAALVFDWIAELGGLKAMEERNRAKAACLYQAIDDSSFYRNDVDLAERSMMNVIFRINDPQREADFVAAAEREGLLGLKGHRAVGGLRASLYNAIELAQVETLVEFMAEFERRS